MTTPPTKTLDDVIDGVVDWAESGRTSIGRPEPCLSPTEATHTIQTIIREALPEKKPEIVVNLLPHQPYIQNQEANQIIDTITNSLKERGLLP